MYLNVLLALVLFCCVGFMLQSGMWSNAIMLVNVVMSALLAVNFFEPLAGWLTSRSPQYTYAWDFVSLWIVFSLSLALLRTATDFLSRVKVKFRQPFDQIGSILFAAWVGWVMVCFTTMTLHTAPLARNFLGGEFQPEPKSKMFFELAPDLQWLGFVQRSSQKTFSKRPPDKKPNQYVFDPHGDWVFKYAERRARFEKQPFLWAAP